MAAGRWVFPIVVLGFLAFLSGYVISTPSTPAPEAVLKRALEVEPGDNVTVEFTQYYDPARRYIAYTTLESLSESGELGQQPFPAGFDARPVLIRLDPELDKGTPAPQATLLGMRIGETQSTPLFPDLFGDWTETRTLGTLLSRSPLVETHNGTAYQSLREQISDHVGREARVGDEFPCIVALQVSCRLEALDTTAEILRIRILIDDGARFPVDDVASLRSIFSPPNLVPDNDLVARTTPQGEYELHWDVQVGDTFTITSPLGEWSAGAYRVDSAAPGTATARYAPVNANNPTPAYLIGEIVWFEFTVVDIDRA